MPWPACGAEQCIVWSAVLQSTIRCSPRQGEPEALAGMGGQLEGRWRDLDYLLNRPGNVVGPGFEPGPEIREFLADDCR